MTKSDVMVNLDGLVRQDRPSISTSMNSLDPCMHNTQTSPVHTASLEAPKVHPMYHTKDVVVYSCSAAYNGEERHGM